MTIAFQGIPGAYSAAAAAQVFPDATLHPCETFREAFAAVAAGRADRAVVPIENTLFGSIPENYDHLHHHPVTLVGDVWQRIRHGLLGCPGATLADLKTVTSHPQALGQCRQYLRTHLPEVRTEATFDTAGAARAVARAADPTRAAIASREAAEQYDLAVLDASIEDNPQNYTRFWIVAPEGTPPRAAPTKTTLTLRLNDAGPGALAPCLQAFARRAVNLTKLESRPLVGAPGRYLFYMDVEAAASDAAFVAARRVVASAAHSINVLGSYPAAPVPTTTDAGPA
ncbi:prephenate dehydratase [Salisaeta longa]|uniref:prephenate dehydratase n=1 Tax=Salisaeta longa TaxID=503170 RepID=UPI0003B79802|nr:prephenate dehydratase [Salisaeta longa]